MGTIYPRFRRVCKQRPFLTGTPPASSATHSPQPEPWFLPGRKHDFIGWVDLVQEEGYSAFPTTSVSPGPHTPCPRHLLFRGSDPLDYPAALPTRPPSNPQHLQAPNPLSRESKLCPTTTGKIRMTSQRRQDLSWALKHEEE